MRDCVKSLLYAFTKKFIIISKIQYNTSETPLRNGKMKQKNRKINRIKIKTINIQSSRICI